MLFIKNSLNNSRRKREEREEREKRERREEREKRRDRERKRERKREKEKENAVCGPAQNISCHLERSHLFLLCGIVYNVIQWSHCELKRDLLYFLDICKNII